MKENLRELTGLSYYEAVDNLTERLFQKYGDLRSPESGTEILAIARGGLIPATYVCYRLGCPINVMYLRSYPRPDVQKQVEAYGILPFRSKPVPKQILVVDDIQDTGRSFDFLREFFKANFTREELEKCDLIYTAVIWRERDGLPAPDIYGAKTSSLDWVVFPYDFQVD